MRSLLSLSAYAAAFITLMSCRATGQATPPRPISPPLLQVRLANDTDAPGFRVRESLRIDQQDKEFFLSSRNVLSDVDVRSALTRPAPDGIVVELTLTDSAAARLRETTANNIGKYIAVLAHGRLGAAATILQSVPKGNRVSLGLTLPTAIADSVRSRVAKRWPESSP